MKVGTIMMKDVAFCNPDARLDQVARLMADHHCSAIPVINDEEHRNVVGILTEGDIIRRSLAKGYNPISFTAEQCMTPKVFVVKSSEELEDCLDLMEAHHVRRLPVIDDSRRCCGIITMTGLAEYLPAIKMKNALRERVLFDKTKNGDERKRVFGDIPPPGDSPYIVEPNVLASLEDLPNEVKKQLPIDAQRLFFQTYNETITDHSSTVRSQQSARVLKKAATKVAWAKVDQFFIKQGGEWVARTP